MLLRISTVKVLGSTVEESVTALGVGTYIEESFLKDVTLKWNHKRRDRTSIDRERGVGTPGRHPVE
jgi:hypothetical protein